MDAKSLSSSSVASRFVSQTQLTEAQKKREEDIRAAYARMGQSPPPEAFQAQEDYDPRTLYDKLKANTDAKQEAFDEKMKLSNQFRGIDDAESEFLADIARQRTEDQKKREEETRKELEEFRRAAMAKESSPPGPLGAAPSSKAQETPLVPIPKTQVSNAKGKGKRKREGLLGIVKKKAPEQGAGVGAVTADSKNKDNGDSKEESKEAAKKAKAV